MHKDQSLKKNGDNPYYFSLAGNLMHTYKSQQLLLSAADASKWPGATAKEADQTLKCFSASSLVRLLHEPPFALSPLGPNQKGLLKNGL